jgi:threonine synthase
MKYLSTRGQAPVLSFDDVLLTGLARDGGLYVPESWPKLSRNEIKALRGLSYEDLAVRIMLPFLGGQISESDFAQMVADSYAGFDHPARTPLKQLDSNLWLAELFHGPTLAFKDYPLQLVGRLFDHVLNKRGERVTIVGATSGDTGSAAIEACKNRDAVEIFILHPNGRVSDVQRRQMTTVDAANVHNIALKGTFDDCQDMVKALFADGAFRDEHQLSAVNSINWARIMSQIVYYFSTALALGAPDRRLAYAVPTGNFGNVYAGYAASRMGLPIERFIVGSNANDILTRYFNSGVMETAEVMPTLSPSMDIQISSNFERLLFEHYGRKGETVGRALSRFRRNGTVRFGDARWKTMRKKFEGHRLGDNATKEAINELYQETGELVDPHSVIGVMAAKASELPQDTTVVSLATAHPAKFPAAVEEATGIHPTLPDRLSDLFDRQEKFTVLANDFETVRDHIAGALAHRESA